MLFNVNKRYFRALSFLRYHQIDAAKNLVSGTESEPGSVEYLIGLYVELRTAPNHEAYLEELAEFEKLCRKNGSQEALYILGDALFSCEDFRAAFSAFSVSAEEGSLAALFRMGDIKEQYLSQCGTGTEFEKVGYEEIYSMAAEGGHVFAKLKISKNYGHLYYWVYRLLVKPFKVTVFYLTDFRDQRILV